MRNVFTLAFILIAATSFAQASLKGVLKDTATKQNLMGATISVLDRDTVLLAYGLAKSDGSYVVNNIPYGSNLVMITFQGFATVYRNVTFSKDNPVVELNPVYLSVASKELAGVTVKAPPVVIKGDTTEFSAGQFKTKPNASTEDLLKKLPGVQVEKDGTVKAQGENVKKVLVDGKQFFGDDPKTATKNLPADIVDKVQVYDAQSEQAAFSGFDDGNREKTINIITKKDKRKGYFGKASAGVGDNERYAANVSLNRFNGNQRISLLAQANNTNQQNFSIQDVLGVMGGGGMFGGGGGGMMQVTTRGGATTGGGASFGNVSNFLNGSQNGIARTIATGLNYTNAWSKNTSVTGSYFYNNMNLQNRRQTYRETFATRGNDSSIFRNADQYSLTKNQNHRLNLEIDQRIDSFNSLLIRPSVSFQETNGYNESISSQTRGKLQKLVDQQNSSTSLNNGYTINNSILWRHRFAKKGRTLSVNLTQLLNNSDGERNNLTYLDRGVVADTIDQFTDTERKGLTLGGNISFTEPIGKKTLMEVAYNYSNNKNTSDRQTMDYNRNSGKYDVRDETLTNKFENTNESHRVSLNFRRQINKEWNYTVGLGVQHAELTSDNKSKNIYLTQSFNNFTPQLTVQYSKNRAKNLRFNYRGSTRQPNITQLQDVLDNTNPLYISRGNPLLKQEFTNNFSLFYTKFDIFTFKNFVASINGNFVSNKIGNYIITNQTTPYSIINLTDTLYGGGQYSSPVNVSGAYNLTAFMNVGFPIKPIKGNLNFTTSANISQDANFVKEVSEATARKSYTRNYMLSERVAFSMNLKEKFDLTFASTSTYTIARFTQMPQQNGNYFNQMFSIEPTYNTKNGWMFGSDFDYTITRGQTEGFNQTIPLLNAYISKTVFKNKAGEIRLSAFDLLKQNKSITRDVQQNYIEDVNTQVLQRYFMLSFTYNLRRFGQGQMPGFFRMMGGNRMGSGGQIRIN